MKNNKMSTIQILKRLLKYVTKKYTSLCLIVLGLIIVSTLANVMGSLFIQSLIDDYITPFVNSSSPNFTPLFNALVKMALIYIVGVVSNYTYNRILIVIAQGTLRNIRDDLFEHMEKLPIKYFDTHYHGDIMSIYTNDTDTLRQMISQSIPNVIVSIFTIISVLISMLTLNVPLTLVTLLVAAVMLTVIFKITGLSRKYFVAQQKNLGQENGYIEEMMEGQKVIKVFNHESQAIEGFEKINEELFESSKNANTFSNILMPILGNLGYLSYVLIAVIGGYLTINGYGTLTIGALASFLQLNRSFNQPISQISQQISAVTMAIAGGERIFTLLDEEVEIDQGKVTLVNAIVENDEYKESDEWTGHWAWKHIRHDGSVDYVPWKGDVRFENVYFGYNEEKTILKDITLFAKPGQKIAFVGATGAGKTTITNLINRFYDIQKGTITYDGIDIKLIKKDDLRNSIGIVLQDVHLFSDTIRENIRFGKLDASDEEVEEAARLANAEDFILKLENGYDTVLTADGGSLSQGQRQLLSIARAAIANPPVLILDEATSSIDTRTEKLVQTGMDKLMEGRTVFVIAHRLSTIKNSDAIMVLDKGEIIERGDHDDLIDQKGEYYQLYTGGFEEE